MAKTIKIEVKDKIAKRINYDDYIVCENKDYVVDFDFDDEWEDNHTKTAIFTYKNASQNTSVEVVFAGNICGIPPILNATKVEIGVYAGDLRTSTNATVPCKKSALSSTGLPQDPLPDVYTQIIQKIDSGALKGKDGVDGRDGIDGKDGANGITTPLGGFFTLQVDGEGNLYAYSNAEDTQAKFEYDEETGDFYILTETD